MPSQKMTLSIAFLQGLIDSNSDAIVVLDTQNTVLICNQHYRTLWQPPGTLIESLSHQERWDLQLSRISHPESDINQLPMLFGKEGEARRHVFRLKSGHWYERNTYDHLVDGQKVGLVIHWRNITQMHEARRAAEYERELMHSMMDSVPDQIFFKDAQSHFIRINPALARRYGLSDPALAIGKSDFDFYGPDHATKTALDEARIMETGEPLVGVIDRELWPDGSMSWNVSTKMPLYDRNGKLIGTYGIAHDITEHKKSEQLIWHQANFDTLTNLPNRRLLRDRWAQALKNRHRSGLDLALLMLDLDHFKEINDTLGHSIGDALLVQAAQRISACLRATDTVARLGGDEFAIILTDLQSAQSVGDLSQKIIYALSRPFHLGAETAYVTASIGITLSPEDGDDIDTLFKHADQAMYLSKSRGRNCFNFFTPELQFQSQTRLRLANDLRQALALNQLYMVYQPIVELATGRVHKAEALLRWQHPQLGLVSPNEFIPLAESSGLIVGIGEWVFREAANQLLEWRTHIDPQMQVSINKSPLQFQHQEASPERWLAHLNSIGLGGSAMAVEITESLLLDNSEQVQRQLNDMRATGIQVSLDDFGTGYSALSYLQRYDIDFIKIDQSFVRDLSAHSKKMALCKAIIHMAHELGMKVVAEGIETPEQHDLLKRSGCDYGQGYLFAKPMTSDALVAFATLTNAPKTADTLRAM